MEGEGDMSFEQHVESDHESDLDLYETDEGETESKEEVEQIQYLAVRLKRICRGFAAVLKACAKRYKDAGSLIAFTAMRSTPANCNTMQRWFHLEHARGEQDVKWLREVLQLLRRYNQFTQVAQCYTALQNQWQSYNIEVTRFQRVSAAISYATVAQLGVLCDRYRQKMRSQPPVPQRRRRRRHRRKRGAQSVLVDAPREERPEAPVPRLMSFRSAIDHMAPAQLFSGLPFANRLAAPMAIRERTRELQRRASQEDEI